MMPLPVPGPQGLGDLLDGAFRFLRAYARSLISLSALFQIPVGIVSFLTLGNASGNPIILLWNALNNDAPSVPWNSALDRVLQPLGGTFVVSTFIWMFALLGIWLLHTALVLQVGDLLNGNLPSMHRSIRQGARRFFPYLGMSLVMGIALATIFFITNLVMGIVTFGATAALGVITAFAPDNELLLVVFGLISILASLVVVVIALVPLAYVYGRWIVAPVVVGEGLGPIRSLTRSWHLTRRLGWRSLLFVMLLNLLNLLVLGLPVSLLQWLTVTVAPSQLIVLMGGLVSGIAYLFNIAWYPFGVIATVLYYRDLRVRGESYDLAVRIAALERGLRPATLPGSTDL